MINTPSAATPPAISIQDLQNLLTIVDLATSRGAFRGPELSQVGQVFDKLNQFLQSVVPPSDTSVNAPQQPTTVTQQSPFQAPTPVMPMTPPFSPKVGI